jgi:hypothetical protein
MDGAPGAVRSDRVDPATGAADARWSLTTIDSERQGAGGLNQIPIEMS